MLHKQIELFIKPEKKYIKKPGTPEANAYLCILILISSSFFHSSYLMWVGEQTK